MNTKLYAVISAAALLGATAVFGAGNPAPKATASVSYLEPENFTDFKLSMMGGESEQKALQAELTKHIERLAATELPAGTRLTVRFRDIDMAGDFEPFRAGSWNDVRILRSIYFPRMDVEYSVTDASGKVVAAGSRKLSDPNYQWNLRVRSLSMSDTEIEADLIGSFLREISQSIR